MRPYLSLGKFLGKSEVAKPVVKLAGSSTKMPDWLKSYRKRYVYETQVKKIKDIWQYEVKELPGIEIYRHDDGRVFVEGKNEYGKKLKLNRTTRL